MWERKAVNNNAKFTMTLALMGVVAFVPPSHGRTKTVGELLRGIEKQSSTKKKSNLPEFSRFQAPPKVNLQAIKPPASSKLYYEEGTNEAELERVTDQLINQAFKLTQQFRTSKRRGELWLRLAELYVEKARLIEYRLQTAYDEALRNYQAGQSKTRPRLNLAEAKAYNKKAIQLYEWFLRDFPKDPKVDQALFFLGYNYFELGEEAKGKSYYERLTKEHPRSPYVDESNFALGEFHFEKEQWKNALNYYQKVAANRRARLYSFALYKSAWCFYKIGQVKNALSSLESVIRAGRVAKGSKDDSTGGVSRIRLATEAIKDLVIFYAEVGTPERAQAYFEKVAGQKNSFNLTEKLAYYYTDTGQREGGRYLFEQLIEQKPNSPKAYDYQYQIVSMYAAAGNNKVFKEELYQWISTYGPESVWQQANRSNPELVNKATQLIETTLRNYILQQHQTAQNSKAKYSQNLAKTGYELYFNTFKESPKLDEMHFFFAELLFDMGVYERSAYHYSWIGENAEKSKYYERALLNAVLSLEKKLPTSAEIKKIVGDSTQPVEFDRSIKAFEKAGTQYAKAFPNGENVVAIRYKIGSLYYYFNQFDPALSIFNEIVEKYPKTQYAEFSANLILDIYNIRKDYQGLETAGEKILKVPELAKSPVGKQVRGVLQRASFKKAQDLETSKDYLKSAQSYESFARANPKSDLALKAYYNAGVNYERSGNLFGALNMYGVVLRAPGQQAASLKKNANKFMGTLYEKTGQYARAAKAFEAYANANAKDREAANFYYNAAVIQDGMNQYNSALGNYQKYFDISRNRDRIEVVFLMAKIWERRGNLTRAMSYYKQYYDSNPSNAAALVEAAFSIAQIHSQKGQRKAADEWYRKTVSVQRKVSKDSNPVGVSFAAEAKFNLIYPTYEELRRIRIPANPATQAKAVQNKIAYLNRLKEELKAVIKYDDGHQIVAALALLGQAFQHMSAALYAAPVPKSLDAEGRKQYMAGIDQIAKPFQQQAIENYTLAIERGVQLEGYNDWLKIAHKELANLGAAKHVDAGETVFLTTLPDWMGI